MNRLSIVYYEINVSVVLDCVPRVGDLNGYVREMVREQMNEALGIVGKEEN